MCADKASTDWFSAISRTLRWNEREKQKSFVVVEEDRLDDIETMKRKSSIKRSDVVGGGAHRHVLDMHGHGKDNFDEEDEADDGAEEAYDIDE